MEGGYNFSVNSARRDIKIVIYCTCTVHVLTPKGVSECAEVRTLEVCARSLIGTRGARVVHRRLYDWWRA